MDEFHAKHLIAAVDAHTRAWHGWLLMWPFKRRPPEYRATRKELWRKFYATETRDGAQVVSEALALQPKYPGLSSGELIRLAYWGASGSVE